jgi:hypothetical protein
MAGPKKQCPECGGLYASAYLSTHMRKAHGIYGGASGRIRKKGMPVRTPVNHSQAVEVFTPPKPSVPKFKVLPFLVLEDQDGGQWLAEKFR